MLSIRLLTFIKITRFYARKQLIVYLSSRKQVLKIASDFLALSQVNI